MMWSPATTNCGGLQICIGGSLTMIIVRPPAPANYTGLHPQDSFL